MVLTRSPRWKELRGRAPWGARVLCQARRPSVQPSAPSRPKANPHSLLPPTPARPQALLPNPSRRRCRGGAWRVLQKTPTYLPLGTCWPPCLRSAPSFFCRLRRRGGEGEERALSSSGFGSCPVCRAQQGAKQLCRFFGQPVWEGEGKEDREAAGSEGLKPNTRARLAGFGRASCWLRVSGAVVSARAHGRPASREEGLKVSRRWLFPRRVGEG